MCCKAAADLRPSHQRCRPCDAGIEAFARDCKQESYIRLPRLAVPQVSHPVN